ncbi:hypothetical protein [Stieleria varia]|uniref:Uncharacterized protein n=1 Tax=Stieleria varia TaxID=2528005 RepID=A0A5C6AX60_9BACT|nr:hypothetical protein [Stieleria varia]TWU02704.1 hypothetical protein Pla52n_37620 [Stieleria varia]
MTTSQAATIGYYTVIEDERTGWTGGLLILDRGGRPLEFQCTLPVRPTRSHEILYGPTLRQHLIGDVIGKLLVTRSKTPIGLLCCDQPEALVLGTMIDRPVVLVCDAAEENEGPITEDMLAGAGVVEVAGARFRVPLESTEMVQQMASDYDDLPDAVEPFERIREAIGEAHSQLARQQRQAA